MTDLTYETTFANTTHVSQLKQNVGTGFMDFNTHDLKLKNVL